MPGEYGEMTDKTGSAANDEDAGGEYGEMTEWSSGADVPEGTYRSKFSYVLVLSYHTWVQSCR